MQDNIDEISTDEEEIQTVFLNTIAGNQFGDYLALANWNVEPVDVDEINCCIVSIRSLPDSFEWNVIYTEVNWGFVIARLGADCVMVGTKDGELLTVRGDVVDKFTPGIEGGIRDIWGRSETDFWLAHKTGLAHWDGKALSRAVHTKTVFTIDGLNPDFAVAVGAQGLVLRFDGKNWQEIDSAPTNTTLTGVFCAAENEIYVAGWNGVMYSWDGQDTWKKIKVMGDEGAITSNLSSPVKYKGELYVCAGALGLYKIQGKKTEHVQDFYCSFASIINDKLIITGANCVAEFDGVNWAQTEINLPA